MSIALSNTALSAGSGAGARSRFQLSTPGILKTLLGGVLLAAFLVAIVSWISVTSSERSIDAIGRQAVPAIVSIQEVRARLVEMDASAANEFLGGGQAARAQYETARTRLSSLLTSVASDSGTNQAERDEVKGMLEQVQIYSGLVETARANSRQGFPVGSAYLRYASNLMHGQVMPAADRLDKLYSDYLETQYASQSHVHFVALLGAVVAGVMLLAVLGFAQVFLSKRMRRNVNPALLAASALIVAFMTFLGFGLTNSASYLAQAKEADFLSLHALWQARALAYDAKADQSLYLVMRGNGQKYEDGFAEKAKLLSGKMQEASVAAHTDDVGAAIAARKDLVPAFANFVSVHESIRQMDKGGDHQKAVETATGSAANQSNGSFARFDQDVSNVVNGEKAHFDALVDRASGAIAWLNVIGVFAALGAVLLTWLGLRPRLNEYRV